MSITISLAFSIGIPCCSVIFCLAVPPRADSMTPCVSPFRGTPRLASFCCRMSLTDFNLYSSIECRTIASLPSNSILDLESFKSNRVCTSFDACWMALETSSRSILLTMSKVFSGMFVALSANYENVTSEVTRRSGFNAAVLCCRRRAGLSLPLLFCVILNRLQAVKDLACIGPLLNQRLHNRCAQDASQAQHDAWHGTGFSIRPLASALVG